MKKLLLISALLAALVSTAPAQAAPSVQQAELTAADGIANTAFGASIAVSGNTLVVAKLPDFTETTPSHGAAYVFERQPGSDWGHATQVAKLTLSDDAAASIGSVAISGDTIVVGAQDHKVGDVSGAGAAYVFVKPAGGWKDAHETAALTASDGATNEGLGGGVAISGDTIAATAAGHKVATRDQQGAVYVFVKPASGWVNAKQTAELLASDGAAADSLRSVAIDGDTIVAGAPNHQVGANKTEGAAYVFVKRPEGWADAAETAELSASDGGAGDQFGFVVSISGGTVVVGSPFHRAAGVQAGAAYVYLQTFAGWNGQRSEAAELTPSDGSTNDRFGVAVGVSGDTAVVGSLLHQVGANEAQGGAYLFAKPGNVWKSITETQQLVPSDGAAHDVLGDAVAMSGNVAFAAAPLKTVGANAGQGVVYAFGPAPAITISAPADGASFTQGQVVVPSFACVAAAGATIASCDGGSVDTSVLGSHTFTVDAVDSDGLKGTSSVTYTVVPAVQPQPKLAITGLKQSARKWHLRAKGGTTFSFRLNKPARVTLRFSRRGRALGAGTLGRAGHAGLNRIRFHGRLSRRKRLAPGRYALQVTATNTAGERSVTRALSFRIVR